MSEQATYCLSTGYYADGERSDGWHWFILYARTGAVIEHNGPYTTEAEALRAGELRLELIIGVVNQATQWLGSDYT